MLSPNTILRDRYRIIHQLGQGGMGAVYQAMDENLSCVVAVKETFATNDEQRRAFRREAELLANLTHVALPRVMDHFTHGEGQFLVMQYVPGHDLSELLDLREHPFGVAKVLGWADQLLDALEELHSSTPPIIHRDIKPANLKVTPKGKVLLLDFGLAKGFAGQMSTAGAGGGKSVYGYTPHYAPLEQMRGVGTEPRSDLYSLAATIWTLLTCMVPPDALSRVAEKEDGNADPLRPAHEINPEVPVQVSNVLQQAMALNRNQRPATASELRYALHEAGRGEVEPPRLSVPETSDALPPLPVLPGPKRTVAAPDSTPKDLTPEPKRIPTMHVDSPPVVPSWERAAVASTAVSFAGEPREQRKPGKRIPLIGAGLLVVVIVIAVVAWSVWPSRTGVNQLVKSASEIPVGMVYVPGGDFMMGRDLGDEFERPGHMVTVKPFLIDAYEVTCEDYIKYLDNRDKTDPEFQRYDSSRCRERDPHQPVTRVDWDDANAYAKWAGKRLPTEEEWELAARGPEWRHWPWGNDWRQGLANANGASKGLAKVGAYKGVSPFGAFDMVGNAWEWTASKLTAYPGGKLSKEPSGDLRVIRGGSYDETANQATTTYRGFLKARGGDNYEKTGFRCVKDPT